MVLYEYDINDILVETTKNQTDSDMIQTFVKYLISSKNKASNQDTLYLKMRHHLTSRKK